MNTLKWYGRNKYAKDAKSYETIAIEIVHHAPLSRLSCVQNIIVSIIVGAVFSSGYFRSRPRTAVSNGYNSILQTSVVCFL